VCCQVVILPSVVHDRTKSGAFYNRMFREPRDLDSDSQSSHSSFSTSDGRITTKFVFFVESGLLPRSVEDLVQLLEIFKSEPMVPFIGGVLVNSKSMFIDFSYRLSMRHWKLGFHYDYEYSFKARPVHIC
jgi:hypothetical protein